MVSGVVWRHTLRYWSKRVPVGIYVLEGGEKMKEREFYVLNYDFNGKKIEAFNIFCNVKLLDGIDRLLEEYISFDDFCEKLDSLLRYCFWSKREYEISVADAFEEDLSKYEKIDVYRQVAPNLKLIANLIIDYHNENLGEKNN